MDMDEEEEDEGMGMGMGSKARTSAAGGAGGVAASTASSSSSSVTPDTPLAIAPPSLVPIGEATPAPPTGEGEEAPPPPLDPQADGVDARRVGLPLPGDAGKWACAIRVVDLSALPPPSSGESLPSTLHPCVHHLTELPQDEAALSVAMVTFPSASAMVIGTLGASAATDTYVLVGTVKGMTYHPRTIPGGCAIRTYRLVTAEVAVDAETGREVDPSTPGAGRRSVSRLQFLHSTPVEDVPYAIAACAGRALVGVGRTLRMYDLGSKKLLRKVEARGFPSLITSLHTLPGSDRIIVGDAAESVHFARYRRGENALVVFADDTTPRHITSLAPLDADTVAGADKFGNVFVLRLPSDATDDSAAPTGGRALWDASSVLAGAPHKVSQVAHFHVGEIVTTMQRATLAGGSECILYATIGGAIGALLPFATKEDHALFTHLEIFLRNEAVSLVGRDHLSYRSAFIPVKDVIDGDLCEVFAALPFDKQKAIAADLQRTPAEVLRKLEDVRAKIL